MPTQTVPAISLTMSDQSSTTAVPVSPLPPTVTLSTEPGSCSPTHPKTKRNLLSTLKNSPSMLRRRMKPPHLNSSRNSWDNPDSTSSSTPPVTGSSFTAKEFHVKYQGRVRVTTLKVSEAVNAVKKLAPELTANHSPASSTEDLLSVSPSSSMSSLASPTGISTLPRAPSPTTPAVPKSPRSAKSPKSLNKSCCLSISKQYVCIDDEERLIKNTIPIATVAYCATDIRYPRAVTLICKNHSSVLMCHVFVCTSREKSEKIVAFIGKAFESAWQDFKNVNGPATPGALANNNCEYFIRGRSKSQDVVGTTPDGSPSNVPDRHSSYELRNGDFSSSPDDD